MAALDSQLCWNHESREAVCRCLGCNRSFCRECVTEHQGRLLCASCFAAAIPARARRTGALRKLAPSLLIAAGLLLAWLTYWGLGEVVVGLFRRNALGGPDTSTLSLPLFSRSLNG
jgi:hypothetical protein